VILLDADVDGNHAEDRRLTDRLYGGDERCRIAQELILGVGGVRMLQALGHTGIERFHLNEGHSSLLLLELLRRGRDEATGRWDFEAVQRKCVFTTHTPVPAGHDQFPFETFQEVAGNLVPSELLRMLGGSKGINLTLLALNLSHYVNGVAKGHGVVTQDLFPGYPINSITNGVHSRTWVSPPFSDVFDRFIPGWRSDPSMLRHAMLLPSGELQAAHRKAKGALLEAVRRRAGVRLSPDVLTLGFARRATRYKRMDLVFKDLSRLAGIDARVGPLQMVFAGKAHPGDTSGMELIRGVHRAARELRHRIPIVYLENYGWETARILTAGCDVWLNTPRPPQEASGTSGMKAAHNGVPSLSVLDGWWPEGHLEGFTGWSIGRPEDADDPSDEVDARHADELYAKLETLVAPLYYRDQERWAGLMRQVIGFNAAFFNTHRMVQEYAANAWI
jgi:starch phosphorylase